MSNAHNFAITHFEHEQKPLAEFFTAACNFNLPGLLARLAIASTWEQEARAARKDAIAAEEQVRMLTDRLAGGALLVGSGDGAAEIMLAGLTAHHVSDLEKYAHAAYTLFSVNGSNWDPNVVGGAVTLMASQMPLLRPASELPEKMQAALINYAAYAQPRVVLALIGEVKRLRATRPLPLVGEAAASQSGYEKLKAEMERYVACNPQTQDEIFLRFRALDKTTWTRAEFVEALHNDGPVALNLMVSLMGTAAYLITQDKGFPKEPAADLAPQNYVIEAFGAGIFGDKPVDKWFSVRGCRNLEDAPKYVALEQRHRPELKEWRIREEGRYTKILPAPPLPTTPQGEDTANDGKEQGHA